MRKASTKTKTLKISKETRRLWAARDKRLDSGDPPQLPPDAWAKGAVGTFYRPLKTPIALRIDNDVLAWLKSQGPGYQGRINALLRHAMERSH